MRDSTDGLCATNWSRNEGSCCRAWSSFNARASGSGDCFFLCATEPGARHWTGTDLHSVQGQSGKSSAGHAGRHGGTASSAGWFCDVGGSSPGPLSARLLPGQVPGDGDTLGRIDCAGERGGYGLVCGSGDCPVWISAVDVERPAGSGLAGST